MENTTNLNLGLEGLEQLIKSVEERKNDPTGKESKMDEFGSIIRGVAKKYASKWVDREDLEQDLWVRILELIEDCGGIENVDSDLVARVAFNKAVDMYRYHRRRYESKAEYIEGTEERYDSTDADYFEALHSDKFIAGYDLVLIKEAIDCFDIGSKKRKYAVLKVVNEGLISIRDLDPWDKELVAIPETEDEEGYIHLLGYKSHCPGSWTCQKREMRETLRAFFRC